ncbi:hypothetical protein B0H67DRAFT_657154, partial [Lasiosphaeris hirsuta]
DLCHSLLQVKTWNCVQCANDAFCDDCWGKQRPHRAGAVGIDGRPHEKVDVEVVSRLTQIFGHNRTPEEQEALHMSDISTTWFGVMRGGGRPFLHCSNRLIDIIQKSQTGRHSERFLHLVSFVGQTGAGKSTVIKMLINLEQALAGSQSPRADCFPAPVTGLVDDIVPTTGDVHFYSDPATYSERRPILYADCEGMNGGEKLPMDERQWEFEVATRKLLEDYKDSVYQVQKLQNIVAGLKATGKIISSTQELLEYYYSSITVVHIPTKGRYMQIDKQIGKLYDVIRKQCSVSFAHKKSVRMLLNADRLQQYVNSAYDHFSRRLDEPFDFVKEALRHDQMPKDFQGSHSEPNAVAIPRAAREDLQGTYTTLLWNTFFEPIKAAFDEFCDNWLRCAFEHDGNDCRNVKNSHKKGHQASSGKVFFKGAYVSQFASSETFFTEWMNGIHDHLDSLVRRLNEFGADGQERDLVSRLHRREVEENYPRLGTTFKLLGHATCFCCVRAIPEHILPCGHILCEPCIQSFGSYVGGGAHEMTYCPFHPNRESWESRPFKVAFKPEDAGVRVLCLDGGGIRGIIELALLKSIERELGGFVPVQNFFDLIVGTSTGDIIALGLGVMHWSVSECLDQFKRLCSDAFTARPLKRLALVSHKSYYKSTPLEAAFQSAFGSDALLSGGTSCRRIGQTRVAVTATSATENRPVIITNYNTAKAERDNLPYQFLRSQDSTAEFKIWEAARATSAAPLYFKPFAKPESGMYYTDGAIHYNCPAWVAHHERQVLWDDERASATKHSSNTPTWTLSYGTPRRFTRSGLNCEKAWHEYYAATTRTAGRIHTTPEARRRHMRINVQLKGHRPGLDQLDEIQSLEDQAFDSASSNPDIWEAAHRLVASSFYFEKNDRGFHQDQGIYRCHGSIQCRFEKGGQDLKDLGRMLSSCVKGDFEPFFLLQENYGSIHETQQEFPMSSAVLNRIRPVEHRANFPLPPGGGYLHGPGSGVASFSECCLSISGFPRELFAQDDVGAQPATHSEARDSASAPPAAGGGGGESPNPSSEGPPEQAARGSAPGSSGSGGRKAGDKDQSPSSKFHSIFRGSGLVDLGLRSRWSSGNLGGTAHAEKGATEPPPMLPRQSRLQSDHSEKT